MYSYPQAFVGAQGQQQNILHQIPMQTEYGMSPVLHWNRYSIYNFEFAAAQQRRFRETQRSEVPTTPELPSQPIVPGPSPPLESIQEAQESSSLDLNTSRSEDSAPDPVMPPTQYPDTIIEAELARMHQNRSTLSSALWAKLDAYNSKTSQMATYGVELAGNYTLSTPRLPASLEGIFVGADGYSVEIDSASSTAPELFRLQGLRISNPHGTVAFIGPVTNNNVYSSNTNHIVIDLHRICLTFQSYTVEQGFLRGGCYAYVFLNNFPAPRPNNGTQGDDMYGLFIQSLREYCDRCGYSFFEHRRDTGTLVLLHQFL